MIITSEDEYSYPLHMTGSASTLPAEEQNDLIRRLHEAVKDVTGKDVEPIVKPRMGFLP